MVRSAQPGTRTRSARRAAYRLHRHGYPRGRHLDPVLDGGPEGEGGLGGDDRREWRLVADAARVLRQELQGRAAEGRLIESVAVESPHPNRFALTRYSGSTSPRWGRWRLEIWA